MRVNKTFVLIEGDTYLDAVDFDYTVRYRDAAGQILTARTAAFTIAFDYSTPFELPQFTYTEHLHPDYRDIRAVPYDTAFWDRTRNFRLYDQRASVDSFLLEHHLQQQAPLPDSSGRTQLQFDYLSWDTTRFVMSPAAPELIDRANKTQRVTSDRYHLNLQLYLDLNRTDDTLLYQISTVLDPIGTFYHYPLENTDLAFLNMQIDLLEIQRRALLKDLETRAAVDEGLVKKLHRQYWDAFREQRKNFVAETQRGQHPAAMRAWNAHILSSLGVDNLAVFPIE